MSKMTASEMAKQILSGWGRVDFGSRYSAWWAIRATGMVDAADLDAVTDAMVELTGGLAPLGSPFN